MSLPTWLSERLRRPEPEPEPAPEIVVTEQDDVAELIEPEDYYVTVACPDPDCGGRVKVPAHEAATDRYVLPGHRVRRYVPPGVDRRCWIGGIWIKDARSIIEIREENGGRLKRAAHP